MSSPPDKFERFFFRFLDRFVRFRDRLLSRYGTGMSPPPDKRRFIAMPEKLPTKPHKGHWVQTERAAHEAWADLLRRSPRAAELLHLLVARVGDHNAVVASQKTLAAMMDRNPRTVRRAVKDLADGNWIEVRQVGDTGSVNAYVLNDRVAWTGSRENLRYSLFSAAVVVSDAEQPDRASLGAQKPLRALPSLFPGERQLPTGSGLQPPSQPSIPGMEPDLPSRTKKETDE